MPSDETGTYGVTFNNGRSVYQFKKTDLILDNPSYNYEVRAGGHGGGEPGAVTARMGLKKVVVDAVREGAWLGT